MRTFGISWPRASSILSSRRNAAPNRSTRTGSKKERMTFRGNLSAGCRADLIKSTAFARSGNEVLMLTDLALYGLVFVISGLIFLPLHALSVRAIRGTNPIFAVNLAIVVSAVAAGAIVWLSFGGL